MFISNEFSFVDIFMRFEPEIRYDMDALDLLISIGEGVQLDFKQGISNAKKIARTLVAFANHKGGKLLIGVQDNGNIIGCDTEEEMYMIYEAAKHFCNPPIDFSFVVFESEEGVAVLEVMVLQSFNKPHFALNDKNEWSLYIREGDKTLLVPNVG